MRRLKGRLGVEQGLPPASVEQFDHYDDLRTDAAARLAFGGFDGSTAMAMADMYLRGDIAVIEDVATLKRARGQGLATAAVLGATAQALRVSARAVYLFATADVARGLYEPLGFERIGGAWECQLPPPGGHLYEHGIRGH
jgi:predicted GNAT family acetyltransferase